MERSSMRRAEVSSHEEDRQAVRLKPTATPSTQPGNRANQLMLQRCFSDDEGEIEEDLSSQAYSQDSDELEAIEDEEIRYESELDARVAAKTRRRPGKPPGLDSAMEEDLISASSGDESAELQKHLTRNKKTKYTKKPTSKAKSRWKVACGRCGQMIYLTKGNKELGVIHKDGSRHRAPYGHIQDYSTYGPWLTAKLLSLVDSKELTQGEARLLEKQVTWHVANLRWEHFDCNATAPKKTQKGMTDKDRETGERIAEKVLAELLDDRHH